MFRDEIFFCTSHFTRMDVVRLGNWNVLDLKNQGQSTVEYLLLIAVVISILTTIFNSNLFKDFIGNNGRFAKAIKEETQWNYRHALPGRQVSPVPIFYGSGAHPSYYNSSLGNSRFFGPVEPYPN